jgi:hypothetical protein
MASFNINQILGKSLKVSRKVGLYKSIYAKKPVKIIDPGVIVGTVYSWVTNKTTKQIFLMIDLPGGGIGYLKVDELRGKVNVPDLISQGSKTVEQELKEKKDKEDKETNPTEYYIKKYGVPVGIGLLIISILK